VIIVMGIGMQNHKCNDVGIALRFSKWVGLHWGTGIYITMPITKWFLLFPICYR